MGRGAGVRKGSRQKGPSKLALEEDPFRYVELEERAYWWREQNKQRQEAGGARACWGHG